MPLDVGLWPSGYQRVLTLLKAVDQIGNTQVLQQILQHERRDNAKLKRL